MATTPQAKLERNQRWRDRNREKLKEVNRTYYLANREQVLARARDYRAGHRERRRPASRAYYIEYRRQYRRRAIEILGGVCVRCGFADWRGLQIDHVDGGGTRHRKSFPNVWACYKHILEQAGSGEYQVLCANCNQIKRYEQGEKRA